MKRTKESSQLSLVQPRMNRILMNLQIDAPLYPNTGITHSCREKGGFCLHVSPFMQRTNITSTLVPAAED